MHTVSETHADGSQNWSLIVHDTERGKRRQHNFGMTYFLAIYVRDHFGVQEAILIGSHVMSCFRRPSLAIKSNRTDTFYLRKRGLKSTAHAFSRANIARVWRVNCFMQPSVGQLGPSLQLRCSRWWMHFMSLEIQAPHWHDKVEFSGAVYISYDFWY